MGAGADKNAEQTGRPHHAGLDRIEAPVPADQGKGDTGHEDDHDFEELAGSRERPDAPMHAGHRCAVDPGAIGSPWRLVDVT